MNTKKTVAVYARTSTTDQNTEGQTDELKVWLDRNGINPEAVEWFVDQETGTTLDRKELKRLQAEVFAGNLKTVVVWKLDRLSRSLADGIQLLADWTKKGVRVVSVTQQLDLSGTLGQTVAALLFGLGQIEKEYITDRQRAGIKAAKRRGIYTGRKPGTTKGNPERAAALKAKGCTFEEIATALKTSVRTVHRYLKNAQAVA